MGRFQDENVGDGHHEMQVVEASPSTHCRPSPSSYSNNTEDNCAQEQGTVSVKHEHPIAVDNGVPAVTIDELVNANQDSLATQES